MYEGEQLKYGWVGGGKVSRPVVSYASTFADGSGKFVYMNAGVATLCDDGTSRIYGFLESEAQTVSSGEKLNCIIDLTAIFRVKIITGTFLAAMIGDHGDLDISSDVQGVDLTATGQDHIIYVDGDVDNSKWADVMMNPAVWGTGVDIGGS